ncbi:hypothetical protein SteCoe_23779 [Stentor coeruleus]|uniref:Uncharacterized protein n=1 Tax=Stentor coeruleus TaxID=5963 RepID=A0A1R2BJ20_9CILI|nr:hypothetical protein SteCoe_23779 [Stentor coeruleus]
MDDSSVLIKDYILTIDSMRNKAGKLRSELSLIPGGDSGSEAEDIEGLKEIIDEIDQEIENLHAEISEINSAHLGLNIEEEWIKLKFPQ